MTDGNDRRQREWEAKQLELQIRPLTVVAVLYLALCLVLFGSLIVGGAMSLGLTPSVRVAVEAIAIDTLICGTGLALAVIAVRRRRFALLLLLIPALFCGGMFSYFQIRLYVLQNPYVFPQGTNARVSAGNDAGRGVPLAKLAASS